MKIKTRQALARLGCIIASGIVLCTAIFTVKNTSAAVSRSTNSYNNSLMHQMTAMVMKRCIEKQWNNPYQSWDSGLIGTGVSNGDVFHQAGNVPVGSWYKNTIYGEGIGDGSLECSSESSSIVRVFAEQFQDVLGTSDVSAVLCGPNGTSGLVTAHVGGSGYVVEDGCGGTQYKYAIDKDTALAYIQSIYDQWLEQSEDAVDALSWDKLNSADFSDQELYQLELNDLEAGCGGFTDSGSIAIKYVAQDGTVSTKYLNPANKDKATLYTPYYNSSTIGKGSQISCQELADNLNSYADEFQQSLRSDQGKKCYEAALADSSIASSSEFKNALSSSYINGDKNNIDYSMFIETDSNGAISCKFETTTDENGNIIEHENMKLEEQNNLLDPNFTYNTANNPDDDQPCFDGGVGALGWIICPVIKLLRQTTENLYDYVITPFLEIDVGAFDTSSSAFKGWQVFQSFANIVFVIFLLVIIFSQVTGYGIDNYGIKRILPKLIIAAVLVNVSFIICQLLVDASNVIGYSVENLFNTMAGNAMTEAGNAAVSDGKAVGATIISGAVGIGGAAAAIATAEIWLPVIILPLMLGTIGIIISCLFVFIILGARRAAAIILVVISPLAFVMYMLPNTKKIFDRWFSAFKAVLLIFPIVGLLMGGGAFAGAILWNVSNDFFLGQLLAALTTVIPFFFIPRILKSSLNAVGNLGTSLSNLGNGISRGLGGITKGAVGNSNWYNNLQNNRKDILEERNRNREQERAQRIVDRMKAREESGRPLNESQLRRRYVAQATLNRLQREGVEAEAGMMPISREVELAQAQSKRRQESISAREDQIRMSGSIDDMAGLQGQLTQAITGGDEIGIEALQNVLSGKGEQGREAVHQAMVNAEAQGSVSSDARRAYASNIMNGKFANEYKNNSRSTFEYAKANAESGSGGNMATYNGSAVNSLTQQKMVDMDEAELTRYRDAMVTMSDEDRQTVLNMAKGTLGNQRLAQGLKTSQRRVLEEIAGASASGGTSGAAAEGQSFNVNNDANRHYDAAMNRVINDNRRRSRNNSNPVNQEGIDQYLDMNDGRS